MAACVLCFAFLCLLGLLASGCGGSNVVNPDEALKAAAVASAHRACTAEARALKAMSLALGESCEVQAAKLDALVHTNQDCKAYFGDATITVHDVCVQ